MRKTLLVALMFLSTAWAASAATVDSLARLRTLFPRPPAEFSTLPFFVWNGEVTETMIDRELRDFSEQGIHGFIVHPRPGLITPYLSDRWFQLIRYTVDRAKKLGMEVWLYDENSYPSGFAGGHVPAEMPESYNQGQGLALQEKGPCKILLQRVGDRFEDVTGKTDPSGSRLLLLRSYPVSGAFLERRVLLRGSAPPRRHPEVHQRHDARIREGYRAGSRAHRSGHFYRRAEYRASRPRGHEIHARTSSRSFRSVGATI